MMEYHLEHLGFYIEKDSYLTLLKEKHSKKTVKKFIGEAENLECNILKTAILIRENRKTYYKNHTKYRFFERYGIKINHKQYRTMCQMVRKDKMSVYLRTNHKREIYAMLFGGKWFPVVYDPKTKIIVTVLTKKEFRKSNFNLKPKEYLTTMKM